MSGLSPEFSPLMLALFVQARLVHAVAIGAAKSVATARQRLAKAAGVQLTDIEMAESGRLRRVNARCRIWASFDLFPSEKDLKS